MKILILLAALVAVTLAASSQDRAAKHKESFDKFVKKHGKKYMNDGEAKARFDIYSKRKSAIDDHNSQADQGLQTYYMEDNHLTDQTEDELNQIRGAVATPKGNGDKRSAAIELDDRQTVPSLVDLRTSSCMPAVKNQGSCGSCWAFSAVTPLEFQLCKKTGYVTTLSEEQLTGCSGQACNGGFYTNAWSYIQSAGGIMKSSAYPYTATASTCKFSAANVAAKVSTYGWVYPYNNETAMKVAVAQRGPIPVAIYANSNFMYYKAGIFNDPTCPTNDVNHAVVVVGYGTDSATGLDYWIVRNSWGSGWGAGGYILMRRGVNMCNINEWGAWVSIV